MLADLDRALIVFGDLAWGMPLVCLLVGGGLFFLVYSGARPQRHLAHAVAILFGRIEQPAGATGRISHFQALATALSATVGLGNIAGVAVALSTGGPGALFWMWITAIVGTSTKFFTCTLAVRFRGRSPGGVLTGGPMYTILGGLGPRFRWLALTFAALGVVGCLPLVVANQLVRVLHDYVALPSGLAVPGQETESYLMLGGLLALLCGLVVFGGLPRLAAVAGRLVPAMTVGYVLLALYVVATHLERVPAVFALIFRDAFSGEAVAGGSLGAVLLVGIRRGAFSNEAGIGTEAMAHGEARTNEPVREGLVAMLGPMVDTLFVCTATGLVILLSGVSLGSGEGVRLSMAAFEAALPVVEVAGRKVSVGIVGLSLACTVFGLTTLFGYSYYGGKCLEFVAQGRLARPYATYNIVYVISIVLCAPATLSGMLGLLDGCFALMAWPTMLSALALAPQVRRQADDYFARLRGAGPGRDGLARTPQ